MSILNRLTAGHLDDAALAEIWTAQAAGSTEVITDSHLALCAECRVRFAAFAAWMEDVRADATAEADQAFPAERLAAQQAQILRRLEANERPARVIAFPTNTAADSVPSRLHRWVAMAAAAGLIFGIGLGSLMDLRHYVEPQRPASYAAQPEANGGLTPVSAQVDDSAPFDEMSPTPVTPRYEALRAFDTMTPRAADYVTSAR